MIKFIIKIFFEDLFKLSCRRHMTPKNVPIDDIFLPSYENHIRQYYQFLHMNKVFVYVAKYYSISNQNTTKLLFTKIVAYKFGSLNFCLEK